MRVESMARICCVQCECVLFREYTEHRLYTYMRESDASAMDGVTLAVNSATIVQEWAMDIGRCCSSFFDVTALLLEQLLSHLIQVFH